MARASRETGGVCERERREGESRRATTNGEREREGDNERAARETEREGLWGREEGVRERGSVRRYERTATATGPSYQVPSRWLGPVTSSTVRSKLGTFRFLSG